MALAVLIGRPHLCFTGAHMELEQPSVTQFGSIALPNLDAGAAIDI